MSVLLLCLDLSVCSMCMMYVCVGICICGKGARRFFSRAQRSSQIVGVSSSEVKYWMEIIFILH